MFHTVLGDLGETNIIDIILVYLEITVSLGWREISLASLFLCDKVQRDIIFKDFAHLSYKQGRYAGSTVVKHLVLWNWVQIPAEPVPIYGLLNKVFTP